MGLSCFRAISGIGLAWGWDLCVGLLYEHRFAVLIMKITVTMMMNTAFPNIPKSSIFSDNGAMVRVGKIKDKSSLFSFISLALFTMIMMMVKLFEYF